MSQTSEYQMGLAKHIVTSKDFIMTIVEEEYVRLLREYLPNVYIYVEFPLRLPRTPAIALTVHDVEGRNLSVGNTVGEDSDGNTIYGIMWNFNLNIDIWALDTKTRDDIFSAIQVLILTTQELMQNRIGLIESTCSSAQERGFDLTDRIIQYASHQITDVQRQLLAVDVVILSTYTPIVEYGWLQSIVFTIGQHVKTIDGTLALEEQTFTAPHETGLRYDEASLVMSLLM